MAPPTHTITPAPAALVQPGECQPDGTAGHHDQHSGISVRPLATFELSEKYNGGKHRLVAELSSAPGIDPQVTLTRVDADDVEHSDITLTTASQTRTLAKALMAAAALQGAPAEHQPTGQPGLDIARRVLDSIAAADLDPETTAQGTLLAARGAVFGIALEAPTQHALVREVLHAFDVVARRVAAQQPVQPLIDALAQADRETAAPRPGCYPWCAHPVTPGWAGHDGAEADLMPPNDLHVPNSSRGELLTAYISQDDDLANNRPHIHLASGDACTHLDAAGADRFADDLVAFAATVRRMGRRLGEERVGQPSAAEGDL
jgi:hypothetical protein